MVACECSLFFLLVCHATFVSLRLSVVLLLLLAFCDLVFDAVPPRSRSWLLLDVAAASFVPCRVGMNRPCMDVNICVPLAFCLFMQCLHLGRAISSML